jgi:sporulation protein YlmC with PRC-barrel domain
METMSARLRLLDLQIVDSAGLPIGRVDDVELEPTDDGLRVAAVACGQAALGRRLGGTLGRLLESTAARLGGSPYDGTTQPSTVTRIDPGMVREVSSVLTLGCSVAELPQVAGLERWLTTHVIAPLPGAGEPIEAGHTAPVSAAEEVTPGSVLLSRILGAPVLDAHGGPVGVVHDLHLRHQHARSDRPLGTVDGLVVGPGDLRSRLAHAWGYGEDADRGPVVLRMLFSGAAARARVVPATAVRSWTQPVVIDGPLEQHPAVREHRS